MEAGGACLYRFGGNQSRRGAEEDGRREGNSLDCAEREAAMRPGWIDGLGMRGKFMVVGASADPIEVPPGQLIGGMRTIQGWASGSIDRIRGRFNDFRGSAACGR